MQYDANDDGPVSDCSQPSLDVCRDCGWPPPKLGQEGNCWARQTFPRFFASEYGTVDGAEGMKKEIYKRGPIGIKSSKRYFITSHTKVPKSFITIICIYS